MVNGGILKLRVYVGNHGLCMFHCYPKSVSGESSDYFVRSLYVCGARGGGGGSPIITTV